jgi:[histone H3]-lysine36 N-dimethyltransferase SETMAR
MELSRKDLRLLLLHEFRLGRKATEAVCNIHTTMGEDVICYNTAKHWFARFKEGNYDLEDEPHPGKATQLDLDILKELIENEPRTSTRQLAERFECSHAAIEYQLHKLGKKWKYGVWIPHELAPHQLKNRVDSCMELLTSHRNYNWLSNLVTGDEKWVMYVNHTHTHKRQWLGAGETGVPTPKPDLHPKMVMLSVWWNMNGVVHWELIPTNTTVTADVYCRQLDTVASKLKGKQDKIYFLHDNARPHIAHSTHRKLLELGWTVLPHPPYSPDLAPTDYHLFRSLAHHLSEKRFDNEDDLKIDLENFFNHQSKAFYQQGILSLPQRWQEVVDSDGSYRIDV